MRRALLSRPINRVVRGALAPWPRRWLPTALKRRLPVVGTFPVALRSGQRFVFRSRGEYLGRVLYWEGVDAFEPGSPSVMARLSRRSRCFWDIGAYGGLYTLIAAATHPEIDLVAFEPLPENFDWLLSNLEANGVTGVLTVPVAVTDGTSDHEDLWVPDDPWPSHATVRPKPNRDPIRSRRLPVAAVSIDGFRAQTAAGPDLIKIDAEGAEEAILAGARTTLDECRPIILCELLPRWRDGLPRVRRLLEAAGYRWGPVTRSGVAPSSELRASREHRNQLLWPIEKTAVLIEADVLTGPSPPA